MGDFPDLKRTSSRQKKRPNFFKAEPATLASAGDFAKPQPPPPKRKRRASKLLQSVEKKLKVGSHRFVGIFQSCRCHLLAQWRSSVCRFAECDVVVRKFRRSIHFIDQQ